MMCYDKNTPSPRLLRWHIKCKKNVLGLKTEALHIIYIQNTSQARLPPSYYTHKISLR